MDFSELFTPFQLGSITLPTRFVMPGMQRGWCENGRPPAIMAEYYRRRAQAGVALTIGEASLIDHPSSRFEPHYPRLNEETFDAWADSINAVHEVGGRMLLQISHPGAIRMDHQARAGDPYPALSPSGIFKAGRGNGRAATLAELSEIREAFAKAGKFAMRAGADGVEIHGCHGYMIDQFLWAETNLREDHYGGPSLENRARFPAEIVAAVREATHRDFLISFRFSQWKEVDYTAKIAETPQELERLLSILIDAGVDVFHPSTRRFDKPEWAGSDLSLAGWVKKLSGLPVIAVGSVGLTVDFMESLVGDIEGAFPGQARMEELLRRFGNNEFDLIAVGRSLISDPDWVSKIRHKKFNEIKPFFKKDLGKALEMESQLIIDVHNDGDANIPADD